MKQCPRCKQTYSDDQLNFCLEDGEMLSQMAFEPPPARYAEDPPPTVMMNERVTNPTNWPGTASPPAAWQGQGQAMGSQLGGVMPMRASSTQTLAVVSLGLGIGSITVGWCCSLGLLLSPGAIVTGLIALSQIKRDPSRYTGRGFAIGGIATGAVFLGLYLVLILIYGIALIGNGLSH